LSIVKILVACSTQHSFHHNYFTLPYESGIDPLVAMKIVYHTDYQTTANIYIHVRDGEESHCRPGGRVQEKGREGMRPGREAAPRKWIARLEDNWHRRWKGDCRWDEMADRIFEDIRCYGRQNWSAFKQKSEAEWPMMVIANCPG